MQDKCKTCKNLDPYDAIHGARWISGPVFQHTYVELNHIIKNGPRGCLYCSLLTNLVNNFVPDWKSKVDKLSLHVTAPIGRPLELRINECIAPDEELNEISNVFVSASLGALIFMDLFILFFFAQFFSLS